MLHHYTQAKEAQFQSPAELQLTSIASYVMSTNLDTTALDWWDKLTQIAQEFRLSCRFSLMRIFQDRAEANGQNTPNGFWVDLDSQRLEFRDITMEHAENMQPEESQKYLAYMLMLAGGKKYSGDPATLNLPELVDISPEAYEKFLIHKAWDQRLTDEQMTALTRKEALQLGHMLNFSKNEMQDFLLRVFDYEDGFRYHTANDLIEVYGLNTDAHWLKVEELKQTYARETVGITKECTAGRNDNWTQANVTKLREKDLTEEKFLNWLKKRASGLDTGSRSALRLYRNLAAFACNPKNLFPEAGLSLKDRIHLLSNRSTEDALVRERIMENGVPSQKKCRKLAEELMDLNFNLACSTNVIKQKSWNVPTVTDKTSKFSTVDGPLNASRRVENLLYGSIPVEKSDMIFMLWLIANQEWDKKSTEPEVISLRLMDFMGICKKCLHEALLPPFYVPHLLEQSMLLSIVAGGKASYDSLPALEYNAILNLEKELLARDGIIRNKESGYKFHSEDEWFDLVVRSQKELIYSVAEFAKVNGVSVPRLNQWQAKFVAEKRLPPFDRKAARKIYKQKLREENRLDEVQQERMEKLHEVALKKHKETLERMEKQAETWETAEKARIEYEKTQSL